MEVRWPRMPDSRRVWPLAAAASPSERERFCEGTTRVSGGLNRAEKKAAHEEIDS